MPLYFPLKSIHINKPNTDSSIKKHLKLNQFPFLNGLKASLGFKILKTA